MWPFGKSSNIEKYNLINEENAVLPNYDLSQRELSIELYFSPQQEVCIIGRLDNNYICWCSLTELEDSETNEKIFNQLVNYDYRYVSQEYLVLGVDESTQISTWYRSGEHEKHVAFSGRDFINFYNELLKKSAFRNSGDLYIDILQHYHILLSETETYEDVKPLIALLEEEAYLRISPDEKVRKLYLACMERGHWLYNRYMDRVR